MSDIVVNTGSISGEITPKAAVTDGEVVRGRSLTGEVDRNVDSAKNYNNLLNKPQINGHELIDDMDSATDLGIEILKEDLTATRTVGGVSSGDEYEQGTTLEQVLRDILNPLDYPTLINPSASIQSSISTLLEAGDSRQATLTVNFNRGSINPAYGTSGYRSGEATDYTLKGVTQSTNQFTETVSEQNGTFTATVSYGEGEQPKDSKGEDYDSPLPAGMVTSPTISFEFVDAIWASTVTSGVATKQALLSKSVGQKVFDFPAQTATAVELFDIPSSWTVRSIEVWNELTSRYESCADEFDTSNVTHENAASESVNYVRYSDNRGYAADGRQIKVTWS